MVFFAFSSLRPVVTQVVRPSSKSHLCRRSLTMSVATSFQKLTTLCEDISLLSGVSGILEWDERVMMPSAAAGSRGKQKAALTGILHEKSTSHELRDAIEEAKKHFSSLDDFEKATVRDAERNYKLAVGVPADLAKEIAAFEVETVQAWAQARSSNDFPSFAPKLTKMLQLVKQKASAMRPGEDPYDTLLDYYERGMSAERVSQIFSQIEEPLKDLVDKTLAAKEKCTRKVHPALSGGEDWNIDKQVEFCNEICKVLGFDFNRGRIGTSHVRILDLHKRNTLLTALVLFATFRY